MNPGYLAEVYALNQSVPETIMVRGGFPGEVRLGLSLERVTCSFNKCVPSTHYVSGL